MLELVSTTIYLLASTIELRVAIKLATLPVGLDCVIRVPDLPSDEVTKLTPE